MNHATIVTLHVNRLRECACEDDAAIAEFDANLLPYVERLRAALPAGVMLKIDDVGTGSLRSLSDNDNNELADELSGSVAFWD